MTQETKDRMKQKVPFLLAAVEKCVGTGRRPIIGIGRKSADAPLQYIVYLLKEHNGELPTIFQGYAVNYEVIGQAQASYIH